MNLKKITSFVPTLEDIGKKFNCELHVIRLRCDAKWFAKEFEMNKNVMEGLKFFLQIPQERTIV